MTKTVLLCDLSTGKTLKVALCAVGDTPSSSRSYICDEKGQFEAILKSFLAENGDPELYACAMSTSGWEVGGKISLVHYGFDLEREALKELLGVRRLHLVNDFVAKAMAIPQIDTEQMTKICGLVSMPEQNKVVLGAMTGFGTALLTANGDGGWIATHCEAAHANFAPATPLAVKILEVLMQTQGHVSRETLLSLSGFMALWDIIGRLDGQVPQAVTLPEEIIGLAYMSDPLAQKVIKVWTQMLASAAADIALTTGARGGVYLMGDVVTLLGELFDPEVFVQAYGHKGVASELIMEIETYVVRGDDLELTGLMSIFNEDVI
jgi:glucokinase